jgi:mono/diheme cytochrome c family protein
MNVIRLLFALVLVGAACLGGCSRGQPRETRPMVIVPDLELQAKYKAQSEAPFFADGRSMRTPPAGTVARGTLKEDAGYFLGKTELGYVKNPRPATRTLLERGRNRFDIYCSPCHGRTGEGKGIVSTYQGMVPPATFHDERALAFEDGYIFEVISQGVRNMKGYAAQIPVDDRWAVVAYVRALQRSRNATLADVPAEHRKELE